MGAYTADPNPRPHCVWWAYYCHADSRELNPVSMVRDLLYDMGNLKHNRSMSAGARLLCANTITSTLVLMKPWV